ncbi:hypothetical protein OUZ56_021180 [Daphnia magna]|uniref:Uncharacterized protein n=1 Tax=Daphnia magna TaxID=35525 RepID=A0ABQ9ZGN8_9CRUS|nr:hypothetical protein OUZ56_021180 [Daphnia magna]
MKTRTWGPTSYFLRCFQAVSTAAITQKRDGNNFWNFLFWTYTSVASLIADLFDVSANEDDVERRRRDQLIGGRQPLLNPARTKKQESGEFRANYSTQNVCCEKLKSQ